MNYKQFKAIFADVLLPLGYTSIKNMFFRRKGDVFTVIDLEKSDFGGNYFVNFGVFVDEGGSLEQPPPFHIVHLQQRLGPIVTQSVRDIVLPATDLEVKMSVAQRRAIITNALEQYVVPYLESLSTIDGIADYINPEKRNIAFIKLKLREIIRKRQSPSAEES